MYCSIDEAWNTNNSLENFSNSINDNLNRFGVYDDINYFKINNIENFGGFNEDGKYSSFGNNRTTLKPENTEILIDLKDIQKNIIIIILLIKKIILT